MADLMTALAGALANEREPSPRLSTFQQAARLREVFALRNEAFTFNPGDLMIHKWPNMADTRDADVLCVFIEYLADGPIEACYAKKTEDFSSNGAARVLDCRIGTIREGDFVIYLADSRVYKPAPTEF